MRKEETVTVDMLNRSASAKHTDKGLRALNGESPIRPRNRREPGPPESRPAGGVEGGKLSSFSFAGRSGKNCYFSLARGEDSSIHTSAMFWYIISMATRWIP
jgi:hypothetical protein